MPRSRHVVTAVVLMAALVLAVRLYGAGQSGVERMVVQQLPPMMSPAGPGGVREFEAPFVAANGALRGVISGSLLLDQASDSPMFGSRLTDQVFHFDEMG